MNLKTRTILSKNCLNLPGLTSRWWIKKLLGVIVRQPDTSDRDVSKPRMIHVGFTNFIARVKVRKAMMEKIKSDNLFKGRKIFVSDDLSKTVLQMKKKKDASLYEAERRTEKQPFIAYPAKVLYRDENGRVQEDEEKK